MLVQLISFSETMIPVLLLVTQCEKLISVLQQLINITWHAKLVSSS